MAVLIFCPVASVWAGSLGNSPLSAADTPTECGPGSASLFGRDSDRISRCGNPASSVPAYSTPRDSPASLLHPSCRPLSLAATAPRAKWVHLHEEHQRRPCLPASVRSLRCRRASSPRADLVGRLGRSVLHRCLILQIGSRRLEVGRLRASDPGRSDPFPMPVAGPLLPFAPLVAAAEVNLSDFGFVDWPCSSAAGYRFSAGCFQVLGQRRPKPAEPDLVARS